MNEKYPFQLMHLPYEYDALEPFLDEDTMRIHHTRHHQAYVDNLNKALQSHQDYQGKTLKQLVSEVNELPETLQVAVRNHGGGVVNHNLFFTGMSENKSKPHGKLLEAIEKTFTSYENFKKVFKEATLKLFGSGFTFLVKDEDNNLKIVSKPNQENPLMDGLNTIILVDLWEHSYYLKFQNKRGDYVDSWFEVIDWEVALNRYLAN